MVSDIIQRTAVFSFPTVVEEAVRGRYVKRFTRLPKSRAWLISNLKWLVAAALFALCVAPTFISYKPYIFTWDDAGYLQQSIEASRAFWSGNVHGLGAAIVGIHPPAMALLGLPWGPLASWDSAGKCFITLAAVISLLAASCLYLLLRIGVKPVLLIVASVCVGAALGPFPFSSPHITALTETHGAAAGFLADSLFAWAAMAAVLFIPHQERTPCPMRNAVLHGSVWGLVFSLGVMTKLSFLYFVLLVVPVLFIIIFRQSGVQATVRALVAFACCSTPATVYLLKWGGPAFDLAKSASFGTYATDLFYIPLLEFLGNTIRAAPGLMLSAILTTAGLVYLGINRRLTRSWPDLLALLIIIGFGIVVLASPNRESRFTFPSIIALPFLVAILISGKGRSASRPRAAVAACLVFCGLLISAVSMRYRPSVQSLARSDAVLAEAARCNAKHIALTTDSPTLNSNLMHLAIAVSASEKLFEVGYLPENGLGHVLPAEQGFPTIRKSDQISPSISFLL
jgi:hypothetical protein